jgi:phosphomethylpyrimidine synthase
LPASQKIYVTPDAAPDLSVPLREITLSEPTEPQVRVYDTTGPYTDATVAIDVSKGLARTRAPGCRRAAVSRNMPAGRSSRSTTAM